MNKIKAPIVVSELTGFPEGYEKPFTDDPNYQPYKSKQLSYGNTFPGSYRSAVIRTIEWLTGKLTLIRLIRIYESTGRFPNQTFYSKALELLRIELLTSMEEIQKIPQTGPVIIVANHPHGLVDGLILAEFCERIRKDFKILTRELLKTIPEIQDQLLPVAFPHVENYLKQNVAMRKLAMEHLAAGGVIILFPAGQVASATSWTAPAVEASWNPFTAKLIRKSDARIVPIYFPGENSRWYHWANLISPTLRQSLLLHEIAYSMKKPQKPIIGDVIEREEVNGFKGNTEEFMSWLRAKTLALGG
ncbi:MAG: lysophospholipid acyltransferase family protein [Rhodobacteraceae bacterium]|nr:lysophospholipid acyltransferase family protein [Paracoccaceae bacterium]MCY4251651.1 lysophospholipid acyltransferase family protein [Paracoccaceae bacterium]MCY4307854.1 lysophospholipid acyltransferase family protein [Paracoccaceae bacterium]